MKNTFALALLALCGFAFAQPPSPKMYPGTDFPGNDLYDTRVSSPDECASRCMADGRCTAFTFRISDGRCFLKWAPSRFEGSARLVSGVIEGRSAMPSNGADRNGMPPPPVYVPIGKSPSCSAQGNSVCSGCSVSCTPGQQASCREGEVHGDTCWTKSKCECLGSGAPPPSVYTPGPNGGPNPNSCSTPDRFACRGCSASCGLNENAICSPSIPGEGNCHSEAYCRCQQK